MPINKRFLTRRSARMLRDKAAQVGYLNIGLLSKDRHKTMKTCRLYQVDAFTSDLFRGIRPESRPLT
jgi:hypothetical protein